LAQNFCASFVQPARSPASAALSCAHAKGAASEIPRKDSNDSLFILLSPFPAVQDNTRVIAKSVDVNKMPVLLLSALTRLAEVHLKVW
jgi:hypothetical protein